MEDTPEPTTHPSTLIQIPKKTPFLRRTNLIRRRKVQTIRLGGKKTRKGFILTRIFKKVKLKWLKLQYTCMLRKLRKYYHSVVKDIIDAGATLESLQHRIIMETYFTVPVMGVSVTGVPTYIQNSVWGKAGPVR
ncbi:hypothetical protein ACHQM5_028078 [Ranunculus cassubicifolius]